VWCVSVSFAVFTSACWSYDASVTAGGSGGSTGLGGKVGMGPNCNRGVVPAAPLPCDVLEGAGNKCVSAHSTVRLLVRNYTGCLYQVQRTDMTTQDIGVVDGYADAAAQEAFCANTACVISIVYDQAPFGNHLTPAPPGSAKPTPGKPVPANRLKIMANGRTVYGMLFRPGEGYRANCYACPYPPEGLAGIGKAGGTALRDEPQTMYMVSSQKDLVNGCCFDYGNAEWTGNNDREGTMEAVYLGQGVIWGTGVQGGPWVMADLENGLYAGWEDKQDRAISTALPLKYDFVSAVVVGDTAEKNGGKGRFALYGGDATAGTLITTYDGIRPEKPGYVPMQKQGSIILSIGGDNSDFDGGRFYEGVVANGAATKEIVDALQQAIVAAGYGK
jgi:hypothetical protein